MSALRDLLVRVSAAILLLGLPYSLAQADSELRNGDFVGTWQMRDDASEQLIPRYWFASEPETNGRPWVKVFSGDQAGVEIKAGESSRYLFQDVKIDGAQPWTLKWKGKGEGSASVQVFPRDDDGNIFPSSSKSFQLTDLLEEQELDITMPAEAKIIRIMLAPGPDSTVTFESIELSTHD